MNNASPEAPAPPLPTRNPLRKLYHWILSWAEHPGGAWALFFLAFAESSFFPIPPDVLLVALVLSRREKAWKYALICTAGSLLGGLAGYGIGWGLWGITKDFWIEHVFRGEKTFLSVVNTFHQHDMMAIFSAAFTPIPYKIFTIAAGVAGISLPVFLVASLAGRGGRFFIVAAILYVLGPRAKKFIDRWFNLLTILFLALLVLGFWLISRG